MIPLFIQTVNSCVKRVSSLCLWVDMSLSLCVSSCLSWGGNTLLAGLPERLQMEIRHMVPADLMESVSVTSPSDRDFSVWCGGAVLASLPVLSSAWISSDEYQEFGPQIVFRKCFWGFVIQRCRIEKSGGVVLNIPACWILNDVTTRQHISLILSLRLTNTKTLLKTLNNIGCINQIFLTIWYIYSKCYVKVLYLCDNSLCRLCQTCEWMESVVNLWKVTCHNQFFTERWSLNSFTCERSCSPTYVQFLHFSSGRFV